MSTRTHGTIEETDDSSISSLKTSYSHLHFGVVGEGRSKKVLAFGSSTFSVDSADGLKSWTCNECQYENVDLLNRKCSMCGIVRTALLSRAPSFSLRSTDAMPQVEEDSELEPPKRELTRSLSRHEFSLRRMISKKLSDRSLALELSMGALPSSSRIDGLKESTVDMARSLANVSVFDIGGWTCPDCTFVNTDPMHLTCGVCSREKPPKANVEIAADDSLREFLSSSTQGLVSGDGVGEQVAAYLKFEQMTAEKDIMAQLVRKTSHVIDEASKRPFSSLPQDGLSELRGVLEEGAETLKSLEAFYAQEKNEYDAMVELQGIKAQEIEATEGEPPQDMLMSKASRPGVQRISADILEWHGQQRMLDDWKLQLDERKHQIKQMREQQQEALIRLLG